MPAFNWPIQPGELIREFEDRHHNPDSGALLAWAVWTVDGLYYLNDLDGAYDRSRNTSGGHRYDVIDVAHCRWATGTCITALDLCAAGLGRVFCDQTGSRELSIAEFSPRSTRRSQLPIDALKWIDAVRSDINYKTIKKARHWLTHSRLKRHFKLSAQESLRIGRELNPHGEIIRPARNVSERVEIEIDGSTRVGPRALLELACNVATKHVLALLNVLPSL
jgi:hypothetical protein